MTRVMSSSTPLIMKQRKNGEMSYQQALYWTLLYLSRAIKVDPQFVFSNLQNSIRFLMA